MEYLRDDDSEPYRQQLDLCREIRNLLTHTSDERGEPVVEPSESVLKALEAIIRHVSMPRYAVDFGTPAERILCASPNDSALDVMRRMRKMGFSHVPVMEKGRMVGVFSVGSLFSFLEKNGLDALKPGDRIGRLKDELPAEKHASERYLFMPENATVLQVRAEFENRRAELPAERRVHHAHGNLRRAAAGDAHALGRAGRNVNFGIREGRISRHGAENAGR